MNGTPPLTGAAAADFLTRLANSQAFSPAEAATLAEAARRASRELQQQPGWPFPTRPQDAGWSLYDGTVYVLPGGKKGHAPMPVHPGSRITVRFRDGEELTTDAPEQMRWGWTRPYSPTASDIVAWRFA